MFGERKVPAARTGTATGNIFYKWLCYRPLFISATTAITGILKVPATHQCQ